MLFNFARSALLLGALSLPAFAERGRLGFSLGGIRNSDSKCKTTEDFKADFKTIKTQSTLVRTYTAHECDLLANLLPACVASGFDLIIGLWTHPTDDDYWKQELNALSTMIKSLGTEHVKGVTVGSEALYRKDLTPDQLLVKIKQVKQTLQGIGAGGVPVGTADSWNLLIDGRANGVIAEADLILANGFSYWQGQDTKNQTHSFFDDIMQALQHVQDIKAGADFDFYVGETGWPSEGTNFEAAQATVANAALYWKDAVCGMLSWGVNTFVFEAFDETWKPDEKGKSVEKHWGVWNADGTPKYPLACTG